MNVTLTSSERLQIPFPVRPGRSAADLDASDATGATRGGRVWFLLVVLDGRRVDEGMDSDVHAMLAAIASGTR